MRNPLAVIAQRTLVRLALGAIAALSLASCSITEPGRSGDAIDLSRNRQLWTSLRVHDYEFDYQLSCFCVSEATEQVHIVVRSDQVSTATRTRDGLPALRQYGKWPTIADLFADVELQLGRKADRLDVSYDATYGYPKSIVVDVYLMAADDESSQSASNLRPLP
jgi:hypothetical protein